jgi:hypothetical protein
MGINDIKLDKDTLLSLLNLFKKLAVLKNLKNNLALLVPIVIAVVAILLFIPTTLLSGRLRSKIETQSVKMSRDIDDLTKKVDQAAEAEARKSYTDACKQDANDMDRAILQTTQRELLSYKLFPDMNETSPLLFEPFRQGYLSGVDAMLKNLSAGMPPADTELYAALEASASRFKNRRTPTANARGNQRLNIRMLPEAERKILATVCEDKAKGIKVYVSPVDLGGYVFWTDWKFEGRDKAIKDCWYWQMAYWILDDVTTTIQQMNKNSETVLKSPVKRIMGALFTQTKTSRSMLGGRSRRASSPKDKQTPTYAVNIKTAMSGSPCTGRFCDDTLLVMQFEIHVIVNTADVMHFMQELCSAKTHKFRGWRGDLPEQTFKHNQIAILESHILPVDREEPDHSSYEYGPDEVVDLDMICEYVFDRAAFDVQKGSDTKDAKDAKDAKDVKAAAKDAPDTIVPKVVFDDMEAAKSSKNRR